MKPPKPQKAAIVCDTWKQPYFEAELKEAHLNYTVVRNRGSLNDTVTIRVICNTTKDVDTVSRICRQVERVCLEKKRQGN